MVKKSFRMTVQFDLHKVTCPGVWLCPKGRVFITVSLFRCTEATRQVKPSFPLKFRQRFVFDKVFDNVESLSDFESRLCQKEFKLELVQIFKSTLRIVSLAIFQAPLTNVVYPIGSNTGMAEMDMLFERCKSFPGIIAPKAEVTLRVAVSELCENQKIADGKYEATTVLSSVPHKDMSSGAVHSTTMAKKVQSRVCHTRQSQCPPCLGCGIKKRECCAPRAESETYYISKECERRLGDVTVVTMQPCQEQIRRSDLQTPSRQGEYQTSIRQSDLQTPMQQGDYHSTTQQGDMQTSIRQDDYLTSIPKDNYQAPVRYDNIETSVHQDNVQGTIRQDNMQTCKENYQTSTRQENTQIPMRQNGYQTTIREDDVPPSMHQDEYQLPTRRGDFQTHRQESEWQSQIRLGEPSPRSNQEEFQPRICRENIGSQTPGYGRRESISRPHFEGIERPSPSPDFYPNKTGNNVAEIIARYEANARSSEATPRCPNNWEQTDDVPSDSPMEQMNSIDTDLMDCYMKGLDQLVSSYRNSKREQESCSRGCRSKGEYQKPMECPPCPNRNNSHQKSSRCKPAVEQPWAKGCTFADPLLVGPRDSPNTPVTIEDANDDVDEYLSTPMKEKKARIIPPAMKRSDSHIFHKPFQERTLRMSTQTAVQGKQSIGLDTYELPYQSRFSPTRNSRRLSNQIQDTSQLSEDEEAPECPTQKPGNREVVHSRCLTDERRNYNSPTPEELYSSDSPPQRRTSKSLGRDTAAKRDSKYLRAKSSPVRHSSASARTKPSPAKRYSTRADSLHKRRESRFPAADSLVVAKRGSSGRSMSASLRHPSKPQALDEEEIICICKPKVSKRSREREVSKRIDSATPNSAQCKSRERERSKRIDSATPTSAKYNASLWEENEEGNAVKNQSPCQESSGSSSPELILNDVIGSSGSSLMMECTQRCPEQKQKSKQSEEESCKNKTLQESNKPWKVYNCKVIKKNASVVVSDIPRKSKQSGSKDADKWRTKCRCICQEDSVPYKTSTSSYEEGGKVVNRSGTSCKRRRKECGQRRPMYTGCDDRVSAADNRLVHCSLCCVCTPQNVQ